MSFFTLARQLREEIEADNRTSQQLEEAKIQLCDRAAGGLLVAYGIALDPDGNLSAGASVQAIPATVFMHPAMTITEWDEVHADTDKPPKYWYNKRLPKFGDIQFNTSEVLAVWPHRVASGHARAVPSSPSSQHALEGPQIDSCALTDAIARIAYGNRDRWALPCRTRRFARRGRKPQKTPARQGLYAKLRTARYFTPVQVTQFRIRRRTQSVGASRRQSVGQTQSTEW